MVIIAVNKQTNTEEIVNDLYFFEENFIHDFNDECNKYTFKFKPEATDVIQESTVADNSMNPLSKSSFSLHPLKHIAIPTEKAHKGWDISN